MLVTKMCRFFHIAWSHGYGNQNPSPYRSTSVPKLVKPTQYFDPELRFQRFSLSVRSYSRVSPACWPLGWGDTLKFDGVEILNENTQGMLDLRELDPEISIVNCHFNHLIRKKYYFYVDSRKMKTLQSLKIQPKYFHYIQISFQFYF